MPQRGEDEDEGDFTNAIGSGCGVDPCEAVHAKWTGLVAGDLNGEVRDLAVVASEHKVVYGPNAGFKNMSEDDKLFNFMSGLKQSSSGKRGRIVECHSYSGRLRKLSWFGFSRVWSTVSPMVDALRFALCAQSKSLWAIPSNVMRSELGIAFLLKYLCYSFEAFDKIYLTITLGAALIVTVCPELIFHPFVRMWKSLPPIKIYDNHFSFC
nr:hypothetical protein Iba_chr05aCG7010 [Ipomoea batatas]